MRRLLPSSYHSSKRSSALVMTMFLVSLMAIMLVGFVASMRTETVTARSHFEGVRAFHYAQVGIDAALARLNGRLASTAANSQLWVTRPGQLVSTSIPASGGPTINWVDLSSGAAGTSVNADLNVDLNVKSQEDSTRNLIFSTNVPARVQWIYVRKDGTHFTTAVVPIYNAANPIVGRYGFWVDDESSKINVNTAALRLGNTTAISHPSQVDLSAVSPFTATDAGAIRNYRTDSHCYDSLNDLAMVSTSVSTAMKTCSYALTAYNHSPELNMFNEPRLMLTTKQSVAGAGNSNFLDILNTGVTEPGVAANIDSNKLNTLINKIHAYMIRADWPIQPGSKFTDKYTEDTKRIQTIINMIDYVRSAESSMPLVEPILGVWDGSNFTMNAATSSTPTVKAILGNSRRLSVVEIGAYIAPQNYAAWVSVHYWVKIYLAKENGANPVNLKKYGMMVQAIPGANSASPIGGTGAYVPIDGTGAVKEVNNNYIINPGEYRVLECIGAGFGNPPSEAFLMTRPTVISVRISLHVNGGGRLEVVPMLLPPNMINCPIDPDTVPEAKIQSMQLISGDPFANKLAENWKAGPNQFAATPDLDATTLAAPTSGLLAQQDTTSNGLNMSAASIRHPAPATATVTGVNSVGELGFVHTGIECWQSAAGVNTSVSFRTLRLQPMQPGSTVLPDWALIDLFCAPPSNSLADKPYIQPSVGAYSSGIVQNSGGVININSRVTSFIDTVGADTIKRMQPLMALSFGATNSLLPVVTTVSSTFAGTIATNICNRVLATSSQATGRNYGAGAAANLYFSPAQMIEIKSIADGGEPSEELIRNILTLATTRGNVFTIYSVGQSIQQRTTGEIKVNGERRFQAMVERRVSGGKVKFQTIFNRDLRP